MATTSLADRRRLRRLSSDDHTAVWTRRENSRHRRHAARTLRVPALVVAAATAAIVVGVHVTIRSAFVEGLFDGLVVATVGAGAWFVVLALSGTMPRGMGATAEMWSADELRRLRKHGWHLVNGVPFERRDVDHVLVGPGGAVVVETKFSADGWPTTGSRIDRAAAQVTANARTVRLWLKIPATRSAVFLWSGVRADAPDGPSASLHGDVDVLRGTGAIRTFTDSVVALPRILQDDEVDRAVQKLEAFVVSRERRDPATGPRRGADRLFRMFVGAVSAYVAVVLGLSCLAEVVPAWWMAGIAALLAVIAAWTHRRVPVARAYVTAGLAGLVTLAVVVVANSVALATG